MTRTDVQKLYSVAGGRWWDPFRAQWELFWARNAVRDLDSLLRRYVTPETAAIFRRLPSNPLPSSPPQSQCRASTVSARREARRFR